MSMSNCMSLSSMFRFCGIPAGDLRGPGPSGDCMGNRAGDCSGGGIAGELRGWGPLGEDFRLLDSDGLKTRAGIRWDVGAEVDSPDAAPGCTMNAFDGWAHRKFRRKSGFSRNTVGDSCCSFLVCSTCPVRLSLSPSLDQTPES